MSVSTRKKLVAGVLFLLVAAVLVPPFINANRFRNRIASSIGGALGREVRIGEVSMVLLPQPGFHLSDLIIQDDPAFNSEPLLQASGVNAYLRLSSLWRGRLEVAQLTLEDPSLNLARNAQGRWNLQSVLQRASQVPAAPTGSTLRAERPRFPYIEAKSGRVNFKYQNVKTAFALADADFAFWQESEGQWKMRLAARPLRTDANLGDTGTLQVNASFMKTEDLADVPIRADLTLDHIQLGQFTSLIYGRDSGWRGDLRITASVTGTSHRLNLESQAHISDFRRYDIATSGALDLDAGCRADLAASSIHFPGMGAALENLRCEAPPGAPTVVVTGDILIQPDRRYSLDINARQVPASFIAQLARRVKRGLPDDLDASGTLDGDFHFIRESQTGSSVTFVPAGSAAFKGLVLRSPSLNAEINIGDMSMGYSVKPARTNRRAGTNRRPKTSPSRFVIDPFSIQINGTPALQAAATLTAKNYLVQVKGSTDLQSVLIASRVFGLERARIHATGASRLDLAVSGDWAGFSAPVVTGSAALEHVVAQLPDVSSPLRMSSATLELTPDYFILRNIAAQLGAPPFSLDGRVTVPRNCSGSDCPAQFDLHFPVLDLDDLNRVLNPEFRTRGWFNLGRFLGPAEEVTPLLRDSQAVGAVTADKLRIKRLTATNINALLSVRDGKIKASQINGRLFGGRHSGAWQADLRSDPPAYGGEGTFIGVDVSQTEPLLGRLPGSGKIFGSYQLQLSGSGWADLLSSLHGSLSYRWENGSILPSAKTAAGHPLRFARWTGTAEIASGELRLNQGTMLAGNQVYQAGGAATLSGDLDLRFTGKTGIITLQGTVQDPVMSVSETAASLESASNPRNAKAAKAPD